MRRENIGIPSAVLADTWQEQELSDHPKGQLQRLAYIDSEGTAPTVAQYVVGGFVQPALSVSITKTQLFDQVNLHLPAQRQDRHWEDLLTNARKNLTDRALWAIWRCYVR